MLISKISFMLQLIDGSFKAIFFSMNCLLSKILFLVLLNFPLSLQLAYAGVYSCTDQAGKITYQQFPCGKGYIQSDNVVIPPTREARFRTYIASKIIAVGMNRQQVVQSWGNPSERRRTGNLEEWFYNWDNENQQTVILKDGVVIEIY